MESCEAKPAPDTAKCYPQCQQWTKLREVETGHRADFEVEVLSGLHEGESVIAHPSNLIVEGVRVSMDQQ
jgi:hypothetical protein